MNDSLASTNTARIAIGGLRKADAKVLTFEWVVGFNVPKGYTILGWSKDDSGIIVRYDWINEGNNLRLHKLDGSISNFTGDVIPHPMNE